MGKIRKELRQEMQLILANLDERWLKAASEEVCEQLSSHFETVAKSIEHILVFQPLRHGFVDLTSFLIGEIKQGRRVYIPCGSTDKSSFFEIQPEAIEGLALSALRVMHCELLVDAPFTVANAQRTAVIMPGLAFDRQGNRIGWGKLSYEQLMSRPGMGRAQKIGVCWELQFLEDLPASTTDLLVDWICYERGIFATGAARTSGASEDYGQPIVGNDEIL